MMTPETARAALLFLDRCPIQGSEALAFLRVRTEIEAHAMAEAQRPEPAVSKIAADGGRRP